MLSAKKGKAAAGDRLHHILHGEQQDSRVFSSKESKSFQITNRFNSILISCKSILKFEKKKLNLLPFTSICRLTSWTVQPRLTSNSQLLSGMCITRPGALIQSLLTVSCNLIKSVHNLPELPCHGKVQKTPLLHLPSPGVLRRASQVHCGGRCCRLTWGVDAAKEIQELTKHPATRVTTRRRRWLDLHHKVT